ncbi:palmitoyltransferase ZDHHC1 [Lampris incognitus]|uniref:palmitoyltransferase ZDHHC1 n=1 Tax=Lampris incognitus TaxID=2546036 RepID=UPI0024B50A8D|nr:palmitoyltransferase ZDHHC1 [Lampris incognitus]
MDVCTKNSNRTAPVSEGGVHRADLPLCSRTNGWSWPPHPFQLLAWLLYLYFAVSAFGVFIPLLPVHWIPAGYICTGIVFVCHLFVHLMAVSVDPADYNVRAKSSKGPVPVFDRSKHAHVIENCHCYLCQVDVGPKSKHCSACNKCVANFDHHCRWLNNCVGSRNYKLFLYSVISALLGICVVLTIATYVFIEFFLDPSKLRTDKHFQVRNETGVWFVFLPVAPISTVGAAIPALAGLSISLGLSSTVLLSHLFCFHIYLMWNRLSTYEYIVRQRHRLEDRDDSKGTAGNENGAPSVNLQDVGYSGKLGYTNAERDVEDPTTVTAHRGDDLHANGRVRSTSSHIGKEALTTVSTENKTSHRRTQRKKQKVPAEVYKKVHRTQTVCTAPPEPSSLTAATLNQRLPFPAFPLRASLPPLAPSVGPVQAAGPPAEYHSDSAESLDEIPVALARLGSLSSTAAGNASTSSQKKLPAFTAASQPRPTPLLRTKRKASSQEGRTSTLKFEMSFTQPPNVFVSRASRGSAEPTDQVFSLGGRQQTSRRSLEQTSRPS